MRMSKAVAVVAGAAAAMSILSTGTASAQPDIIGGGTVSSAPWGAQIHHTSDGFQCSGSIIAPQWVLTARHCLSSSGMYVRVGNVNLDQGTRATVDRHVASSSGDVALLHLATSVNTTYMRLADSNPETGSTNQIYGWGATSANGTASPVLKTADVRVTGTSTDAYNGQAIRSTGVNGAAWHGDSGGPQLSGGVQVGVCSTGSNNGSDPQGTQNYSSVAAHRDWIRSTAGV
jgi:secreted trypsin-like serine protease